MKKGQIVVTGAAGGMGQALVKRLTQDGNAVLAIDHHEKRLNALAVESDLVTPLCIDLVQEDLIARVNATLLPEVPVVGLVNLAGKSVGKPIHELSLADWRESFDVNVTASMLLIQGLTPHLMAAKNAAVVNVGSPVGRVGANKPSYAASKAALLGLTMSCARNLGEHGVRVNLLLPGTTITHMTEDWSDEKQKAVAKGSFLGRLCRPEEVASVIAFLLGPDSSYITGSTIDMTAGGMFGH